MTHQSQLSLLHDMCFKCKEWAGKDIVHVLVCVLHKMKDLEERIAEKCRKVHLF